MSRLQQGMTFDQEARYRLAAEILSPMVGSYPRVLDVGSREGFLPVFIPEATMVNLDSVFFQGPGFVQGDGSSLPFSDRSFDAVIALDVLEHIEPALRPLFLDELSRVADQVVVLSSPFDSPAVKQAETMANEFHLLLNGTENKFLAEHQYLGLPKLTRTREALPEQDWDSEVYPNLPLDSWLLMMGVNFFLETLPESWEMILEANKLYRQWSPATPMAKEAYGQMICWSRKGGSQLPPISPPEPGNLGTREFFPKLLKVIKQGIEVYKDDYEALSIRHRRDMEVFSQKLAAAQQELDAVREDHGREITELTDLLDERARDIKTLKAELAARPLQKLRRFLGYSEPEED